MTYVRYWSSYKGSYDYGRVTKITAEFGSHHFQTLRVFALWNDSLLRKELHCGLDECEEISEAEYLAAVRSDKDV